MASASMLSGPVSDEALPKPLEELNPPLVTSESHTPPAANSDHLQSPFPNANAASPDILSSSQCLSNSSSIIADDDVQDSVSSLDQDAEGFDDTDHDGDLPTRDLDDSPPAADSSTQTSPRGLKRKNPVDEDQYILQDPELYGLRRSGRARQNHRVIESGSDEENSGSDVDTRPARKRRKASTSRQSSNRLTPRLRTSSPSDSDEDTYGSSRARAQTKKNRRLLNQSESLLAPWPERFSTRRAAKVTTYNEDDNDEFEEDESELTPSYWAGGADDTILAIDAVLNHRVKEGVIPDQYAPRKADFEFFLKWQGKAHYHATWESASEISGYRGYRRLENYFKRVVLAEATVTHSPEISPEEREKWNLDRERDQDALLEHMQVERVIAKRDGQDGTEYLVKWKGLNYDSNTWEDASLVSELSQTEIDRFLDRVSTMQTSNRAESNSATRSAYKPFKDQPSYVKNGELREFQIRGVNFLAHNWCRANNVILADEMGLGKTVQTVSFMSWLRHERQQQGPFIVVVPLSTMPSWADTFNHWTPDINYVVYSGNEAARSMIRDYEFFSDDLGRKIKFNVLLTTYEYILADAPQLSQLKWQFMAVDEAHRLKNRDSQLYAKLMDFGAPCRLLITGTPIQNNLSELSALMDFLMPGKITVDENIDLNSEAASRKLAELTDAISPYMIRRTKQKVENDLPPKTERILRIELSDIQLEYYKNILTKNYTALNQGAKGEKMSLLNIMMELKKACNHPFIFPNAEERLLAGNDRREDVLKALITSSGKMMLLDQLLKKLKEDNHRVLIFSQMVRMLDILGDYLHARGHQFQRLDGTIAAGPRRMAIDHFNAPESNDFCFLLSTRAGGLGINLMTADTVILFDSDWNPQADLQAMARAHRIGQRKPVTIYRFVSKDTVEEEVLERARNKLMLEFITIQRGVTDKDAKELSDRMARAGHNVNEPTSADDINRILRRRGQKMFEQSNNQKKLEDLDINLVLENAEEHKTEQPEGLSADGGEEFLKSFEYTDVKMDLEWDEIIPKEKLEEIKTEEERKRHEQFLAEQVAQNAPRKRKTTSDEREQRAAKKRARDLAEADAADDDESDSNADPKRPMTEKEIRNLIKSYEKYGSLEERGEELIKDAKLAGRDRDVLKATLDEVLGISRQALKAEQDRLEALEKNENKNLTKKDKKAVLFDYKGVKRLNAETLIDRPGEMRMLKEAVEAVSDFRNFRLEEAVKPAHYTSAWGAREDGMLCVGISRHGFGAWVAIRDDTELGLSDKFYLEEHRVDKKEEREKGDDKNVKSPGAVHLVRRSNYLLSVLKDKTSNGTNTAAKRALDNHHRNNKKSGIDSRRLEKVVGRFSSSPAPSASRKAHRESDSGKPRIKVHSPEASRDALDRHGSERPVSRGDKNGVGRAGGNDSERSKSHRADEARPKSAHRDLSSLKSAQRENSKLAHRGSKTTAGGQDRNGSSRKEFFRPVVSSLRALRDSKNLRGVEKVKVLKDVIKVILPFIRDHVKNKEGGFEDRCWQYIAEFYWPNKEVIPADKLKALFVKQFARSGDSAGSAKDTIKSSAAAKVNEGVAANSNPSAGTSDAKASPLSSPKTNGAHP